MTGLTEEGLMRVPGLASRWVRLADGARAHYVTAGETGPNILLIHGHSDGSSGTALWRTLAPFLGEHGFRVYCPDLPGYGLSDTNDRYLPRLGMHDHLAFLKRFADALCLDRFHIGGNSMGCTLAAQYILNHPDQIISYALIAGSFGVAPPETPRVPSRLHTAPFDGTAETVRAHMKANAYDPNIDVPDDLVEMRLHAARLQAESMRVLLEARQRVAQDPDLAQKVDARGRFDKLTIPGIYVHGIEDKLVPVENAYVEEDQLPNVQFFYPERAAHLGHVDRPELFQTLFLEFFRRGRVSAALAEEAGISRRRPPLTNIIDVGEPAATPA